MGRTDIAMLNASKNQEGNGINTATICANIIAIETLTGRVNGNGLI